MIRIRCLFPFSSASGICPLEHGRRLRPGPSGRLIFVGHCPAPVHRFALFARTCAIWFFCRGLFGGRRGRPEPDQARQSRPPDCGLTGSDSRLTSCSPRIRSFAVPDFLELAARLDKSRQRWKGPIEQKKRAASGAARSGIARRGNKITATSAAHPARLGQRDLPLPPVVRHRQRDFLSLRLSSIQRA